MKLTNDNTIVRGFVCRNQDILSMKFGDPCFKCLNDDLGLGGKTLVFFVNKTVYVYP